MKKKKRPAKKESPSISLEIEALLKNTEENLPSWLRNPDPLLHRLESFSPEEQEDVLLVLMKKENEPFSSLLGMIMGKAENLDLVLGRSLGRWVSPRAAALLHRLASLSSSKAVMKAIRKSIFQLRSQGLEVKDIEDSAPSVYRGLQPASPEGFLSSIDPAGTRLVWLVRPQLPQGALAFHALISDLRGIIDFNGFETSRKKFHEYLEEFREGMPWEIVEADPDYCHGLIIEAAEINQEKAQPLPEEFSKWRPLMGTPPQLPLKPLIYLHLAEDELKNRSDLLDRSASLFELPSFQTWFLEDEEIPKYLSLLKEASESRLVLTPFQKEGRVMDIYRQAVEEIFDKPRRAFLRRRLEEMAYLLWKTGRQNEAQMTLAAALGMESEGGIFFLHPFLLQLVKRSFTARLEEEAKKQKKDSDLLIKP